MMFRLTPTKKLTGRRCKTMRQAAIAAIGATIGITVLTPTTAHADGTYRWQNARSGNFLEIYHSSTSNGAVVIVYPSNPNSANQYWSDFQLSGVGDYRQIVNYNSGKSLDRYDHDANGDCFGWVWDWTGQDWQWWRYQQIWSSHEGRYFDTWHNHNGCSGNPYKDMMQSWGIPDWDPNINMWLDEQDDCTEGNTFYPTDCWWKRNGN